MALQAVAVTLGTPDTAGEISITVSNLAAAIAQAVVDTTTLQTAITSAQADAATADTNMGTVQTQMGTVKTNTATTLTDATTADNKAASTGTDYDSLINAMIAITGDTYNSTTKQITFGGATGLTHAQIAALAFNTVGGDLVTLKTNTATAKADATTADNAAATNVTNCTTAKAATATVKADVNALSTATVAADHTSAQAIIASANVFLQFDDGIVTSVGALNAGLVAGLTFVRKNNILPT